MKIYKPYEPTLLSKNLRSFKSFIKESKQPVNQQSPEGRRINNEKGDCS